MLVAGDGVQAAGVPVDLEGRLRGVPFSSGFRPFHPFEAEARTLRTFEHTVIPGLFQTGITPG